MINRDEAIRRIEDSRESHVHWADYWDKVDCQCEKCVMSREDTGDAQFHREQIEKYDGVLEFLRSLPA